MEAQNLLNEGEAAKILRVCRVTMRLMRKRGDGPPYLKLGPNKGVRYQLSDIMAWIETKKQSSSTEM